MNYPNPCDNCQRKRCNGLSCDKWKIRYLYRQKQINIYARGNKFRMPKKREVFLYENPDEIRRYLQNSPCAHCKAQENCDIPCPIYRRWWDARMEQIRKRCANND